MVGTEMVHRRPRRRFTVKLAGGKLRGDVKGANESDKDDVGRSDADVEDSLNDDLQTKKIVDQTRAVRKSHQSYDRHRIRSRFAASAFQDAAGVAALLVAIPEVPTAGANQRDAEQRLREKFYEASWKALELAISMTMAKQQGKVTNNQSGGRFDPDFAALFGDVFEVVEKVAGEALKGGSVYTVLTLYVTIRNLVSRSSSWSTANVARFSPAYCWKSQVKHVRDLTVRVECNQMASGGRCLPKITLLSVGQSVFDRQRRPAGSGCRPFANRDGIPRIDVDLQETEDDRAVVVLGKRPVIKTTTRQTFFLLVIGLVVPEKLKLGDESEQGLTLPAEYYARVKAKEVDERPTEHYSGFDGLDKQIQELIEAVVLPMTHKDMFKNLGIHPPKGVLHVAVRFRLSTFLKLAGLQLVQMFIGDRAKLVRDAFALAKEKSPAITSCTRLHCRRI
ncbi:conserved hypothetical protein [Culex quinquefasciatus]|uniref:Uncharacterized protein n=1 Tax=Culex quinquefasciatus TaxID=7176 RepID=B0WRH0_CULQU|nr:conserved hypothetical protein [Culex quinquefasciatus]|eukprot:XP_001851304.1 conserved hypothetical protein [Culex quinquefasciatus]